MTPPSLSLSSSLPFAAPRGLAAVRLHGLAAHRPDGLSPGQRWTAVAAIVALHLAGVWHLMQGADVPQAAREATPMFVAWLAPVVTPPAPVLPPLVPIPAPTPTPRPVATAPAPPAPRQPSAAPALIAEATSRPSASTFVAAAAPPGPPAVSLALSGADPAIPAVDAALAAAPAPPAPASAAPRNIAPSAVQYLVEPAPEYPRVSTRQRETGRVLVRVFIDEAGRPGQAQVARSSGFARLDESAVAAVARSRFRPPTVDGQPVSGWTHVPIDFALEK